MGPAGAGDAGPPTAAGDGGGAAGGSWCGWLVLTRSGARAHACVIPDVPYLANIHTQLQRASLTPEQEAKRYQMTRQVQELDELIQAKAEEKRRIDKEIDGLLAQKRRCVGAWVGFGGRFGVWVGVWGLGRACVCAGRLLAQTTNRPSHHPPSHPCHETKHPNAACSWR